VYVDDRNACDGADHSFDGGASGLSRIAAMQMPGQMRRLSLLWQMLPKEEG